MEESIKILEEKLKIIESLCTDDCINKSTVIQPLKYALENLIKGYRELEEKVTGSLMYIDNECVRKSKIKEKIEELVEKNSKEPKGTMRDYLDNEVIRILQELMEDKQNENKM